MATQLARSSQRMNAIAAATVGGVLIVIGLLGFALAGDHSLTGALGGQSAGVFHVNTLHNLVHVAVGAALVAGGIAGGGLTLSTNRFVGAALVALGGLGFVLAGPHPWNLMSVNGPDNALHLAIGVGLLVVSYRRAAPPQDPRDHEVRGAAERRS